MNRKLYRNQLIKLKQEIAENLRNLKDAIARPHIARTIKFRKQRMGSFAPPAQTLSLLTTISSGRCRMPLLEYDSHSDGVSKICLINSWQRSLRSSFETNSTNDQKNVKLQIVNSLNNSIVQKLNLTKTSQH